MESSSSVSSPPVLADSYQKASALYGRTMVRAVEQKTNSGYGFALPASADSPPQDAVLTDKESAKTPVASFNDNNKSGEFRPHLLNAALGFAVQNMAGEDVNYRSEKAAKTYAQMPQKLFPNQSANRQNSVILPSERTGFNFTI